MKKVDKEYNDLGIAFLDVISCGFGAIIMLVILAKDTPINGLKQESTSKNVSGYEQNTSMEIAELEGKIEKLEFERTAIENRLKKLESKNKEQRLAIAANENKIKKEKNIREVQSTFSGGIPVDRDYVVFIIDTSGSMKRYWNVVIQQIQAILKIHPKIKGIQVMSDNGEYLLEGYSSSWIPDTKLVRDRIVQKLLTWSPYSNSSPSEGLERALRFHAKKQASIYVMGDDFTGASYDRVIQMVNKLNPLEPNGQRRAKIHGIGFPWGIDNRFPTLMRELAYRNNGVFLTAKIPREEVIQ
ncbi:MAG: hypothetical protein CBC29_00710 [Methylococcaceae bacterium TMED69]|nr:MAG: hypothetical protein CBC29_00710 [Methylococcaceae bacterium TMED69]